MKISVELEVALLALRAETRGKKTQVDPVVHRWVDEALTRNYWRHLCERNDAELMEAGARRRRPVDQAVADNAA